jgi:hypothetical protein
MAQQQNEIQALTLSPEEQAVQIQKVSDQLAADKLRRAWSAIIGKTA